MQVVRKLYPITNLVKNGSFDKFSESDIDGWTCTTFGGVTYRVAKVKESVQVGRFGTSVKTQPGPNVALEVTNLGSSYLQARALSFPIEYSNADDFSFSFNYRVNLTDVSIDRTHTIPLWVKLQWQLRIGDFRYNTVTGWTQTTDQFYNDIYIDKYNVDQTFEAQVNFRNVPTVTTEPVTISFFLYGSTFADYPDIDPELIAAPTINTPLGRRVRVVTPSFFYYTLVTSDKNPDPSDDDYGEWWRPNDYDGVTNRVAWHKDAFFDDSAGHRSVGQFYLDEVKFQFFPNREKAPEEEIITIVNNKNFKEQLSVEIESGDLPSADIHSKRFIYSNYFKTSSGAPTSSWSRGNVSESATIQTILARSLVNQYKYPTFKVSGSFLGFTELNFLSTLVQTSEATAVTISNEEFTGNVTGWENFDPGYGLDGWAYSGSNSARVEISGGTDPDNNELDSLIFRTPAVVTAGTRLMIEVDITRSVTSGVRSDWVQIIFMDRDSIVQTAVVTQFDFDGAFIRALKLSVAQDITHIGFKTKNLPIPTTGTARYDMNYFRVSALDVRRYFTVHTMEKDEVNNSYRCELMQLVPVVPSADPTIDDSGEANTNTEGGAGGGTFGGGSSTGSDWNSDYNNDYGG